MSRNWPMIGQFLDIWMWLFHLNVWLFWRNHSALWVVFLHPSCFRVTLCFHLHRVQWLYQWKSRYLEAKKSSRHTRISTGDPIPLSASARKILWDNSIHEGKKTALSLTTLEKQNSMIESPIVSLELSDLRGENHISVKMVFSTPELPATTRNRPTQQDINKWPHLSNIQIDQIDGEVSWVINGPLGRSSTTSCSTINFLKAADVNLDTQFQNFCNLEFNDVAWPEQ